MKRVILCSLFFAWAFCSAQAAAGTNFTISSFGVSRNELQKRPLHTTTFPGTNLPAGWSGPSWSITNGATALTNGWGHPLIWDKRTKLEANAISARIVLDSTNSQFCLIWKDQTLNVVGTVAMFDATNNRCLFYRQWDGGSVAPDGYVLQVLAAPAVAGREYELTLSQDGANRHLFEVLDCASGTKTTVSADYEAGSGWDAPGVLSIAGSVTLKSFTVSSLFPRDPAALILGHSFVSGNTMDAINTSDSRFAALVRDALGGNVVIAGVGGDTWTNLVASGRMTTDLDPFRPQKVFAFYGANDSGATVADCVGNIMTLSNRVAAVGGELVLSTTPPYNGYPERQDFYNAYNAWVLTNGLDYVDVAALMTTDGDRVTRDASKYIDDIHPNAGGHAMIAAAVMSKISHLARETGQSVRLKERDKWPGYYIPMSLDVRNTNVSNTYYGTTNTQFGLRVRAAGENALEVYRLVGTNDYGAVYSGNTIGPLFRTVGAHKWQWYFGDNNTANLTSNAWQFAGTNYLQGLRVTNAVDGLILTNCFSTNKFFVNGTLGTNSGNASPGAFDIRFMDATSGEISFGGDAGTGNFRGWIQARREGATTTYPLYINPSGGMVMIGTGGLYLYDSVTGDYQAVTVGANDSAGSGYRLLRIPNTP